MQSPSISEQRTALFARQRRGQGEHADYVPGLTLSEVPKAGRVHRYPCDRAGRTVTLRSDGALATFLEEHWDRNTTDLRDLMPLDVERTSAIARHLGLRHPTYEDGSPRILITDLVVTRMNDGVSSYEAIDTQSSAPGDSDCLPPRIKIAREYWTSLGAGYRLSEKDGLNSNRAKNLNWLYMVGERVIRCGLSDHERSAQRLVVDELFGRFHWCVEDACVAVDRTQRLNAGESVRALRQLLATQEIWFDIDAESVMSLPPHDLRRNGRQRQVSPAIAARHSRTNTRFHFT